MPSKQTPEGTLVWNPKYADLKIALNCLILTRLK